MSQPAILSHSTEQKIKIKCTLQIKNILFCHTPLHRLFFKDNERSKGTYIEIRRSVFPPKKIDFFFIPM